MAAEDPAELSTEVQRYRRLCAAFDRLHPLDEAGRAAALRELDPGDADLREELESMLAAAASPGLQGTAIEDPAAAQPGAERGYRVLRELGRGGMGRVLLAERADGRFTRQVAIKVLDRPLHDADWRRRFEAERAILARLLHPNIARLLDAGETASGVPYLVMEYIDGQPLDRWLQLAQPPLEARLAVFEAIARAIAHAHQSLVAHRDLKPGNVLVDAQQQAHVLDFGIARLLDDGGTATETGLRALTPRYAAPEQIAGAATSAAVDVYQLGLLLCELLTGRTPFAELTGPALLNAVLHSDPLPPSQLAARAERPLPWRQALDADLDAIVLMALRRDPQQRYRSVDALLDDLQRWRDGLPVLARRGGRIYRTRKFLRRHWLALAAAALVLAMSLGFVLRLQQELARSEREQAIASQVTALMVDVLGAADPRKARGRELTLREALDLGVERLRDQADLPDAVRGRLLHELGIVYSQLSEFEQAGALLEEALPLRERAGSGVDAVNTAYALAVLRQRQGRIDEAQELVLRALSLLEQIDPADRNFRAELHNGLAILGRMRGDNTEAARHFEQAVELLRAEGEAAADDLGPTLRNFSEFLDDNGDSERAARLQAEAQALVDRHYPGDDPEQSRLLRARARNAMFREDFRQAGSLLEQAAAMNAKLYPGDHDERVRVADLQAQLAWAQGDARRAEALFKQAVEEAARLYPGGHARLYAAELRLAGLRLQRGEVDSARALLGDAVRSRPESPTASADRRSEALLLGLLDCADPAAVRAARTALVADPMLPPWLRAPWIRVGQRCLGD